MAALAIWIKVVSPGPVFYVAPRVGLRGRRFGQIKLRTMHINADKLGTFTARRDPRIIKGGEIIRTVRLDELPQFFNVLKGEMSVVGPRPEDIDTVENHFTQRYRRTLDVLPGLTGIRQIRNWPDLVDARRRKRTPLRLPCTFPTRGRGPPPLRRRGALTATRASYRTTPGHAPPRLSRNERTLGVKPQTWPPWSPS